MPLASYFWCCWISFEPVFKKNQHMIFELFTLKNRNSSSKMAVAVAMIALACLDFGCKNDLNQNSNAANTVQAADTLAAAVASVDTATTQQQAEPTASSPTNNSTKSTSGKTVVKKLHCGSVVSFAENGMEAKLLASVEDKSGALDQTWYDLNLVAFESGTSKMVMPQSAQQLNNIAQIVKCYPSTQFKIGINPAAGNTGVSKVAYERLAVIKATLIGLGVPPTNLLTTIAKPDSTPPDMGPNHHIALQLTAK